ncbi:MAG: rubredoxin [Calditrichaeota bacterium]|nr:rubredoxin [Calditrichota bacterium]
MKWRCSVCGYVHDGDEAPDRCPKCGAPKEKFTKIESDKEQLIERARFTNNLHMQLSGILDEVLEIAAKGIDDNLDPGCVAIFKAAQKSAWELKQSIKAEIETHISKGKWG